MTRGDFRPAALVAIPVLLSCVSEAERPPLERPHVLLISIDTLRGDHLSGYGYSRLTSPFIDRLAAEGTRFSHAYANTHGTPPSHATLFTSLYQETHRVGFRSAIQQKRNDVFPLALQLLPEILQGEGYATLAVTGAGFVSGEFGVDQGFDSFDALRRDVEAGVARLLRRARSALRSGRPIFAFFHTYEVHSPYAPPGRYERLFGRYESSFEPTSKGLKAVRDEALTKLSEEDLRAIVASYDRGIRYTDDALRNLFSKLRTLGFFDDAIVVITSDHGEELGEHGSVLHGVTLYDELLHVPLVFWGTGVPAGVVDPRLVGLIDVAPTVLAATGVAIPSFMQGEDLLAEPTVLADDRAVFSQYADLLYAVRTPRWKLIEDRRRQALLLYDLRLDPREQQDVARQRPEVVHALAARLRAWREDLPVLEDLEPRSPTLSDADLEGLRSLGYLD